MLEREPSSNALKMGVEPFDPTPENHHQSKSEFLAEKSRVIAASEHIDGLFYSLHTRDGVADEERTASDLIRNSMDKTGRQAGAKREVKSQYDLIIKNALEHGLYYHTLILAIESKQALICRLKELEDQEKSFWSTNHRPPNHYARTIALRLARLYAREKKARPTYGTARDGGHPSTAYAKALEEVFEELKIKAQIRLPAQWAIAQITDDDLKPVPIGGMLGFGGLTGFPAPLPGGPSLSLLTALGETEEVAE